MIPAKLPKRERERLQRLYELGILDTLEEQAYDDLTRLAAQICSQPIALVSLVDAQRQWFKSHYGLEARETPRELAFCAHAILGRELFVVEDSSRDERFHDNPLVTGAPHVRFYAGAPLVTSDDLALGTLCVIGNEPCSLTPSQKQALSALARQVVSQLELRLQVKELQRLDRAKDEFVSMVSHELRTPLTSICGSLSLLQHNKAGALQAGPLQMVQLAHRNADRLLNIVNDILDLTKIEAGKLQMRKQPLDVHALVRRALDLNRSYLDRCACSWSFQGPTEETLIRVNGDEQRLLQVLTNLLSNAAKFTADGDTIEVSVQMTDSAARIEVTDHGPGIPLDQQSLLFKKFQQIAPSEHQKLPGTGLGLHISKQIVELHDGELGFESRPDEYTTFFITLPLAPSPVEA